MIKDEFIGAYSFSNEMLKEISSLPIPQDFSFVVGRNVYQCYKIFACLLSPAVVHVLRSDATVEEFQIDFEDKNRIFPQVLEVFSGKFFEITEKNAFDVYQIASHLQNEEILNFCAKAIKTNITKNNIFERLSLAIKLNIPLKLFLDFIAKKFEKLSNREGFFSIPIDIISEILKSDELNIPSQTWLVRWIEDKIEEHGEDFRQLIEAVQLNDLEPSEICDILETVTDSNITSEIFLKIKSLFIDVLHSKQGSFTMNVFTMKYRSEKDHLHGIVYQLTKKFRGNVCEKGVVDVIVPSNTELASDLLNYENRLNSHWKNDSIPEQNWILFDFKNYVIQLSAYTIRGCYCKQYSCRPKSWEMLGSNDRKTWTCLSKVTNCTEINKPYGIMTFDCNKSIATYQYFKFVQLENNETQLNSIVHLSAFEFFGNLRRNV